MKHVLLIICLGIALSGNTKSFAVKISMHQVSADDRLFAGIKGGDTLFLMPGKRGALQFKGFKGDARHYITIINGDGLCEINEDTLPYGISIRDCHYIKLCGTGNAADKFGIKIAAVNHEGAGLGISDRTDNIEICFIEISHTKGPGILCKTNPDCVTNRDNYTMFNTSIHNLYVHHTGTEGMYIGSTAYEGEKIRCKDNNQTAFPPVLQNVWVFHNTVEHTGWDGIQISNAINVKCYSNNISFDSEKNEQWQNCGLIIGGGAQGKFYNNTIAHGNGYPINCFGKGVVEIRDNTILQDSTANKTAIYINDKLADGSTKYIVVHNRITTHHYPAINTVTKKQRKKDIISGNTFSSKVKGNAVYVE